MPSQMYLKHLTNIELVAYLNNLNQSKLDTISRELLQRLNSIVLADRVMARDQGVYCDEE
jgi:hypothetical protein